MHLFKCLWCISLSEEEMDLNIKVQNLNRAVCISYSANTLWKGMNQTILPTVTGKIVGQIRPFNLGMATGLEGKPWIQSNCRQ